MIGFQKGFDEPLDFLNAKFHNTFPKVFLFLSEENVSTSVLHDD